MTIWMLLLIITCILMALIFCYLVCDVIKTMTNASLALVNLVSLDYEEYLKEKSHENDSGTSM